MPGDRNKRKLCKYKYWLVFGVGQKVILFQAQDCIKNSPENNGC